MTNMTPRRLQNERFFTSPFSLNVQERVDLERNFDLHWHEFYELTYFYSGTGTNIVNGVPLPIIGGSLFLLTPADFHEIHIHPGEILIHTNIQFKRELLSDALYEVLFSTPGSKFVNVPNVLQPRFLQDIARLHTEMRTDNTAHHLAAKAVLDLILLELKRLYAEDGVVVSGTSPRKNNQPPWIHRALLYMEHHFREPIALKDLAEWVSLSPSYFSDSFHKATGIPFQRYMQSLRLEFAYNLLRSSSLPVTDICFASGFNTLTHFEKVFREKYNFSPRMARKK